MCSRAPGLLLARRKDSRSWRLKPRTSRLHPLCSLVGNYAGLELAPGRNNIAASPPRSRPALKPNVVSAAVLMVNLRLKLLSACLCKRPHGPSDIPLLLYIRKRPLSTSDHETDTRPLLTTSPENPPTENAEHLRNAQEPGFR